MRTPVLYCLAALLLTGVISCSKPEEAPKKESVVVIPVQRHPHTFNPVIARSPEAMMAASLVFPGLYYREIDTGSGAVRYTPQLASWSEAFGSYVMVRIKPGAMWSDDIPVNAKDILYSYGLYANEQLNTPWRPLLNGLKTGPDGAIDLAAAIQMDDDSTLTFNFVSDSAVNFDLFTVPIVPRHQMDALPAVQLKASIPMKTPTIAGPFLVAGVNEQEFVLRSNPASTIPGPARVDRLHFRVVQGRRAVIDAFKASQVDVATDLSLSEVAEVMEAREDAAVVTFPPLRYHVIGWNTIDGAVYRESNGEKLKANRLFGSPQVRRAMTLALDREKIITEAAGKEAVRAFGPVSPVFKDAYHDTLHQLYCDPAESKVILAKEQWQDLTRSGTVEKFNRPFAFELKVASDDAAGLKIAEMVKTQLKEISVDVTVLPVDPKTFPAMIAAKDFDAYIGTVDVPRTLDLAKDWGMDLTTATGNAVSFRNKRVSEIMDSVQRTVPAAVSNRLWKEFQDIIQEQQPYTFLYWESRYAVHAAKVRGLRFSPEGFITRPWEWSVVD
ncbi:MAG: hypothetical protein HUU02_05350 [Bacteroidetes bacterium]|nr:hypothetical protein [Bacteroidota bacterium]